MVHAPTDTHTQIAAGSDSDDGFSIDDDDATDGLGVTEQTLRLAT